jgi:formyl-CoA transferase
MALFNEQRQLPSFLAAIGRPDLTGDPRFTTPAARKANAVELSRVLDAIFETRDLAEWRTILDGIGITFGIVATVNEALHDPQMRHAGAIVPFADGGNETIVAPFHIDGVEKIAPRRAPSVGQHNDAVLADAGYSGDDIARLRGLGVFG